MRVSDWSSDVCSSDLSRTCWYVVVELVRALGLIGDSVRRGDDQRLGQAIEKLSGLTLLAPRLASDELGVLINLVEATAKRFANNSRHSRVALLAERAPAHRLRQGQFAPGHVAPGRGIVGAAEVPGWARGRRARG